MIAGLESCPKVQLAFCEDGVVIEGDVLLETGPLRDLEACRQMTFVAEKTKKVQD
jgi:hypothetical protein